MIMATLLYAGGVYYFTNDDDSVGVAPRVFTTRQGGTATNTAQAGYILYGDTDNTWTQVSSTTLSGASGFLSTTTPWTDGDIVVVNSNSNVKSTSSINSTLIADEFVFNTGDTMTGQLIISGVATDITTVTNQDLTLNPNGSGVLDLVAGSGGLSITTDAGNSNITINPHGSGDVIFSDFSNAVLTVDGSGTLIASTTVIASYIEDAFLLNTGDTGTGVYDFGGATSFEIPNASNPTLDAAGEVAVNTNNDTFEFATSSDNVVGIATPIRFAYASSTWTATSAPLRLTTGVKYSEIINSGICYANGTGRILITDGTNDSNIVTLASGTTTVTFTTNKKFNAGGENIIFEVGTPGTLGYVNCTFDDHYYVR